MIVAFLNHKGGVGKTTLALHVAGAWAGQGKHIVVLDTDSQGSALDWSEPRDADACIRSPGPTPSKNSAKAHHFTARLTIDVTPDLCGRIKVAAFRREITVAEMLRDLLSREFPPNPRGTT